MPLDVFASLITLANISGRGYATARISTESGSDYTVEMHPFHTTAYVRSATIGQHEVNIDGAYIPEDGRLYLNACDGLSNIRTSRVRSVSIANA